METVVGARGHEREIQVTSLQARGELRTGLFGELDIDVRMTASVVDREACQDAREHQRTRADAEQSRLTACQGSGSRRKFVGVRKDDAGPL